MKKRTKRIDDEREFQVGVTPEGDPVWTTIGELGPLNGDEKLELSHNISVNGRQAAVMKLADAVEHNAGMFVRQILGEFNPEIIQELETVEDSKSLLAAFGKFDAWMAKEGLTYIQDGLTTVIKKRGKVVAELPAKIDPRFALEVAKEVTRRSQILRSNDLAAN